MVSKLLNFFSSIRLAVPLLAAIALILIGATFYESSVGAATVQRVIYKSPWFGALMFLLAVNLGLSTLSRYPWRGARKAGFALTHWGLVVIIAGSAAVIHISTEGMLLLRTDGGPGAQIRVEGDQLEVVAPDGSRQQADVFVRGDGSVYPPHVGEVHLSAYSDQAIKTVAFVDGGPVDNLALKLALHSDRMGQTLERWLALAPAAYHQLEVGPARLELVAATTDRELEQWLAAPAVDTAPLGILAIGGHTLDVQTELHQTVTLGADLTVEVAGVWPDFRLDSDRQPSTASPQWNNPAVQINLTQGQQQARWFVFANAGTPPVRSGDTIEAGDLEVTYLAPAAGASDDYFRVVMAPEGDLHYAALSSKGFQTGLLVPGVSVSPGWADFQISLVERLDQAQVQRQVVPVTPVAQTSAPTEDNPALQVSLAGQDVWLPWGEPTALDTVEGTYFAAYSPKLVSLPFYIKLNEFIVERNEGSESVAMWTSDLTLYDPVTDTTSRRSVWMNHPTWFRGWKLAQASWNPGDLQQSTLQLKREPWWVTALTWLGSVMVVAGIGTMFYGPGLAKRLRRRPAVEPSTDNADQNAEAEVTTTAPTTIPLLTFFRSKGAT